MNFKSTLRQSRRRDRTSALNRVTPRPTGNLREMLGLQLRVKRDARKRLARNRDPPLILGSKGQGWGYGCGYGCCLRIKYYYAGMRRVS